MDTNNVVIRMILKYCESIVCVDLNFEPLAFVDLNHLLLIINDWFFDLNQSLDFKF